jgi:hypothetical protein
MWQRVTQRGMGTAASICAAAALLVGCGSSSGSGHAQTVSLARAADVSSAAAGYRTALQLHETVPGEGAITATGTGRFTPARHLGEMSMQMSLPAASGMSALQMQIVLTGETIYLKLPASISGRIPGGKPWLSINLAQAGKAAGVPGLGSLMNSSSSLSDPGQYLDFLRATSVGSVKDLGQATVNGLQTTHYHAEVDVAKLPQAVPAQDRQAIEQLVSVLEKMGDTTQFPIDVWVDSSHLVRRVQTAFSEPAGSGQSVSIALTENFLSYGAQPAPTIPSPGQTADLLSLLGKATG